MTETHDIEIVSTTKSRTISGRVHSWEEHIAFCSCGFVMRSTHGYYTRAGIEERAKLHQNGDVFIPPLIEDEDEYDD